MQVTASAAIAGPEPRQAGDSQMVCDDVYQKHCPRVCAYTYMWLLLAVCWVLGKLSLPAGWQLHTLAGHLPLHLTVSITAWHKHAQHGKAHQHVKGSEPCLRHTLSMSSVKAKLLLLGYIWAHIFGPSSAMQMLARPI